MKRIWVLEEVEEDRPLPSISIETMAINIKFSYEYGSRNFRVISITPDSVPKMGFDEWWQEARMKYLKYAMIILLIISLAWGIYSHYSIVALENRNNVLLKSNDALIVAMKEQQVQWKTKFDNLELRAKQLEATLTQLNVQYSALAKRNTVLETKIASLKIPEGKEARIAKYKELGYDGEGLAAGSPAPHEGVLFDWISSDKLLQTAMESPLIKEQNTNLKDEVAILEKKASTQDQIIKNTEKEVKLALDRAEFAEGQIIVKDKIIADQGRVNEDLVKKAKRAPYWFAGGFIVGVLATIFVFVGLGI